MASAGLSAGTSTHTHTHFVAISFEIGSIGSFGKPGTSYVDQSGLELKDWLSKCWD